MATKDQLIASAQKNLEKGQINKAIKDYQELLKLEPKVDQHKQKLADLLCRANLKADALGLYDSLAKGYAERGFFAKAVAVYKQMQRIDTADTDIYLRLAELNRSLGLIGNAMAEYRSLLEFYEKRNMAVEAAGTLQKMVELEPENINLQLRVLQYMLKQKLYDKVKEALVKACEACQKSADTGKSYKILQAILPALPGSHEFHVEIATRLCDSGLYSDSIYIYQYLLKSSPQNPVFLEEISRLYGKSGDAANEILSLSELLVVQPMAKSAERLVRLCIESGDFDCALRKTEEMEALLDDENHTLLIELYQELENHLPGDQRVRSAIVRLFGGTAEPPLREESPLSTPLDDLSLGDTSGNFTFGGDEFQLQDLLLPQSHGAEISSMPLENPPEDNLVEVLVDFPEEDQPLEIDELLTDENEEISSPVEIVNDEIVPSLIDIDFDFSEGEDAEVDADAEIEIEIESVSVEESNVSIDLDGEGEEFEEIEASEFDTIEPSLEIDLSIDQSSFLAGSDDSVVAQEIESEDEEEILDLEPLEELEVLEEIEEEDLASDLAALEALLETEMEESPSEAHLDMGATAVAEVDQGISPAKENFFDLAAELLDDGALQATEGLANVGEIDRFRFDSVFSEFKKGVDAQIDLDDTEAHYDLGIAYKEMGLMDDAIEEFKKSMRHPKRLADSLILIGICKAEKGAFADAEMIFSAGIVRPEIQEADKVGMQYELGLVYEIWGRPADALRTFEAVAQSDPTFRNVGEKIESLRLHVAAEPGNEFPDAVSPGKDRVSFV